MNINDLREAREKLEPSFMFDMRKKIFESFAIPPLLLSKEDEFSGMRMRILWGQRVLDTPPALLSMLPLVDYSYPIHYSPRPFLVRTRGSVFVFRLLGYAIAISMLNKKITIAFLKIIKGEPSVIMKKGFKIWKGE